MIEWLRTLISFQSYFIYCYSRHYILFSWVRTNPIEISLEVNAHTFNVETILQVQCSVSFATSAPNLCIHLLRHWLMHIKSLFITLKCKSYRDDFCFRPDSMKYHQTSHLMLCYFKNVPRDTSGYNQIVLSNKSHTCTDCQVPYLFCCYWCMYLHLYFINTYKWHRTQFLFHCNGLMIYSHYHLWRAQLVILRGCITYALVIAFNDGIQAWWCSRSCLSGIYHYVDWIFWRYK